MSTWANLDFYKIHQKHYALRYINSVHVYVVSADVCVCVCVCSCCMCHYQVDIMQYLEHNLAKCATMV